MPTPRITASIRTVSYTHLDVYKRQAQQPGGTQTAQDTAGLTAQLPVAAAARAMNWNGKEVK